LSIADGGEIEFLQPGQPLPVFDLKVEVKNKKPNRKPPARSKAEQRTAADCSNVQPHYWQYFY